MPQLRSFFRRAPVLATPDTIRLRRRQLTKKRSNRVAPAVEKYNPYDKRWFVLNQRLPSGSIHDDYPGREPPADASSFYSWEPRAESAEEHNNILDSRYRRYLLNWDNQPIDQQPNSIVHALHPASVPSGSKESPMAVHFWKGSPAMSTLEPINASDISQESAMAALSKEYRRELAAPASDALLQEIEAVSETVYQMQRKTLMDWCQLPTPPSPGAAAEPIPKPQKVQSFRTKIYEGQAYLKAFQRTAALLKAGDQQAFQASLVQGADTKSLSAKSNPSTL